jgi:hypothetical protein
MQTYRNPRWSLVAQAILGSFMALIGVSVAVHPGNAAHPGTAPGYIASGCATAAACIAVIVGQLMSRLAVTKDGLSWRSMVRTRSLRWADIQDVLVVPAASFGPWYSPGVRSDGRLIRINSVIGPRRYTEKVVTAIRDAQVQAIVAASTQDPTAPAPPET